MKGENAMSMKTPTLSLDDIRREYLCKFIGARNNWKDAEKASVQVSVDYWNGEMRKYAKLLDLTTRLQNEMKGRAKQ